MRIFHVILLGCYINKRCTHAGVMYTFLQGPHIRTLRVADEWPIWSLFVADMVYPLFRPLINQITTTEYHFRDDRHADE